MKIQIKNRYTEEVIYECEAESLKEAVEKAVKEKADLSEANLREADLRGANLRGADLSKADLREADLSEADINAVFYKTKITKKQKTLIDESDLFEIVDEDSSSSNLLNRRHK